MGWNCSGDCLDIVAKLYDFVQKRGHAFRGERPAQRRIITLCQDGPVQLRPLRYRIVINTAVTKQLGRWSDVVFASDDRIEGKFGGFGVQYLRSAKLKPECSGCDYIVS